MREIGTIDDEARARRLVDYLLTLDVEAEARVGRRGWGIWVHREDQVERGRAELAAFLADPDAERYRGAARTARERRREAERVEREHRKKTIELRDRLNTISPERCPVTHALIALSLAMALISGVGSDRRILMPFYFAPWEVVQESEAVRQPDGSTATEHGYRIVATLRPIAEGQVWRLFTPMFIHYGFLHLIFNMIWLYRLGGLIELRKSWRRLLLLVMTASPASFLAEHLWDNYWFPEGVPPLPGGMSGVIYALFGYVWMKSDYEPESDLKISTDTIVFMLLWLVLCMTGLVGRIANAAHFAGLAFGMLVGLAPHLWASLRWR